MFPTQCRYQFAAQLGIFIVEMLLAESIGEADDFLKFGLHLFRNSFGALLAHVVLLVVVAATVNYFSFCAAADRL